MKIRRRASPGLSQRHELFPAKQARIVRLLVERVEVEPAGSDTRLRVAGLASLVRDLAAASPDAVRTAA